MNYQVPPEKIAEEVEKKYQKFLDNFGLLKKENDQLLDQYGEKLEQRKLLRIREQITKND